VPYGPCWLGCLRSERFEFFDFVADDLPAWMMLVLGFANREILITA
jgi:hypothetical protein